MNKQKISTKQQDNSKGQSKLEIAAKSLTEKPLPIEKLVSSRSAPKIAPKQAANTSKPSSKTLPAIALTQVSKPATKIISKPIAANKKLAKKDLLKLNPENETYFVYLKNPLEYRRQLLECSRKVLFCLKINQEVFLIRQKKLEEMHKLKSSVRELLYLNKKFNEKLPKYNMGVLGNIQTKDKIQQPAHIKSRDVRKPVETKGEKTEMERLEESLASIEKKLKTLQ
jgi:hypothetical protein